MALTSSLTLRRSLAAVLMFALALAGVGRPLADMPAGPPASVVIAGVVVHLCDPLRQDGPGDPGSPAQHHKGCDSCALCAPALLPASPALAGPSGAARLVRVAAVAPWTPPLARRRTPRQAQGPPAA